MDTSGWNMYVFRDGRRILPGTQLVSALRTAIEALDSTSAETVLTALLAAGELECALADTDSPHTFTAATITNEVAAILVGGCPGIVGDGFRRALLGRLERVTAPDQVRISVHEGFAYYALHPLKFAQVLEQLELPRRSAVIGIRSIGVALSAVTCAAMSAQGVDAHRITVRPTGHPYNRDLKLDREQLQWVRERCDAEFYICDEGPGLSGSSFIAVGEALVAAGVPSERITFIATRIPDAAGLRTTDPVARWTRFKTVATANEPFLPDGADIEIGGGRWRERFLPQGTEWPGSWTQLERLKYVSGDEQRFFRFEGYGHYGAEHASRASLLADGNFGPGFLGNHAGFGCYEFVHGTPLTIADASSEVLSRLARYCAFRAREFPTVSDQPSDLEDMVRFNWKNEFGAELPGEFSLPVKRLIVCDSHMLPLKFLRTSVGSIYKVDAVSHGDGHFFPGPCDIAWDLAGTISEWRLGQDSAAYFLKEYAREAGEDARDRIYSYLLAYNTFRFAYGRMAARAMGVTSEEPLFLRDYERYRSQALETFESVYGNPGRVTALVVRPRIATPGLPGAQPAA